MDIRIGVESEFFWSCDSVLAKEKPNTANEIQEMLSSDSSPPILTSIEKYLTRFTNEQVQCIDWMSHAFNAVCWHVCIKFSVDKSSIQQSWLTWFSISNSVVSNSLNDEGFVVIDLKIWNNGVTIINWWIEIHWNTYSRTINIPDNLIFLPRSARITPTLSKKYLQPALTCLILTSNNFNIQDL